MSKLDEIRKKLQQLDNRSNNRSNGPRDTYAFWNLDNNKSARVRFLPDGNEENTFFWVEKQMINLKFPGILGDNEDKEIRVQVPCMEMYGKTCPVTTEIRPWWNDPSLKDMASQYWKKRTYIFHGFVVESDMVEEETPDNPIRRFNIGPQLFKIVKNSLLDPDFESIPTDFINGTDFTITKGTQGNYADYSTSKWARRETALTEEQLSAIKEHGLNDLSSFLPDMPSEDAVQAIYEMFLASVEGELYDPSRWAKFYRPYGFEYNNTDENITAKKVKVDIPTKASDDSTDGTSDSKPWDDEPNVTEAKAEPKVEPKTETSSGGQSAEDILKMIRQRKANG